MISTATDDALTEWSPMRELFDATKYNNRKGAMAFPGDPLAFWRDARDGRWYTALAIDGCGSNAGRLPAEGLSSVYGNEPCCDQKFGARWSKIVMLSRFVCCPSR